MRRSLIATFACLAALAAAFAPAAAEPAVIDMRIDQQGNVTVGDRVRYTIVLAVDAGTDIGLAAASLPPQVSLIDAPIVTRQPLEPGSEEVTLSFEVAPFAVGDVAVPPLALPYTQPGGDAGALETPASLITVASVLTPGSQPVPRDLKPQAEIGTPPPTWPLPAATALAAAVVLLLFAALARRQLARYRAARALRRVPVLSGPEDIARGILNQAGAAFGRSGDYGRYYTALGNTVRYYLTQRYGFPAFALTTRELEEAMAERGLDRWQIRVATGLLNQCDAVVYAHYRPAPERADADLTAAFEIVEMSRPEDRPLVPMQEEAPVA